MSTKTIVFAAAATLGLAVSSQAFAQDSGFYVSGALGANQAGSNDYSSGGTSANAEFDLDWAGLGAFGYALGNGFRVEAELSQRTSEVDKVGSVAGDGSLDATALMANVLYDIKTDTGFTPYIGAGIGAVRLAYDNISTVAGSTLDDNDLVLGGQAILGVGYELSSQLDMFAQYSYLRTTDPDLSLVNGAGADGSYDAHTVFFGLRYSFAPPPAPMPVAQVAAPAPAPTPAPPPPPADIVRTYIVFFDFDSDAILPAARETITQAVENAKKGGVSRLVLTGHTDTSGRTGYNQALSERRARNVQGEMQTQGLTNVAYTVLAKGESEPLVPTADGVREPQNRRVEIVLQ